MFTRTEEVVEGKERLTKQMNTMDIPREYPVSTLEVQARASQNVQDIEALKQESHRCALATKNVSASLALAATSCLDAGSNASNAAIALLVGSVASAEITEAALFMCCNMKTIGQMHHCSK